MHEITPPPGAQPGARPGASFDPQPVRLEGRRATIEPLELRHASALFEVGSESTVWRYLPRGAFRSVADATGWVQEALEDQAAGAQIPFAIIDAESGKVAGSTRYLEIRPEHWGLEIGWTWLGPAFQRTGINTECKYLLLSHAFDQLDAMRVQLKTDERNTQSQRAIERIGAVREGTLRAHMLMWDGHVRDSVYFSITRSEWPAVKDRLQKLMAR